MKREVVTVGELRRILSNYPGDMAIALATPSHAYHFVNGFDLGIATSFRHKIANMGYTEDEGRANCLVLQPIEE